MKQGTKDELEGKLQEAKGKVKEKVGQVTDNPDMETKKGIDPIKPELERIAGLTDMAGIVAEVARLHRLGVPVVFGFGAQPDPKDSNKTIGGLRQGGLALPDRDYYLKQDAKSVEIRQHYVQHVENMFKLAGDTEQAAALKATMVMDFEMVLAKDALDRVSMRDPNKTYHMLTRKELVALAPNFDWEAYFKGVGAPAFDALNVAYPDGAK